MKKISMFMVIMITAFTVLTGCEGPEADRLELER